MFVREARDVHNCSDKCEQHQHEGKREKCLHGNEERGSQQPVDDVIFLVENMTTTVEYLVVEMFHIFEILQADVPQS